MKKKYIGHDIGWNPVYIGDVIVFNSNGRNSQLEYFLIWEESSGGNMKVLELKYGREKNISRMRDYVKIPKSTLNQKQRKGYEKLQKRAIEEGRLQEDLHFCELEYEALIREAISEGKRTKEEILDAAKDAILRENSYMLDYIEEHMKNGKL